MAPADVASLLLSEGRFSSPSLYQKPKTNVVFAVNIIHWSFVDLNDTALQEKCPRLLRARPHTNLCSKNAYVIGCTLLQWPVPEYRCSYLEGQPEVVQTGVWPLQWRNVTEVGEGTQLQVFEQLLEPNPCG